jgi:hypothetical protein
VDGRLKDEPIPPDHHVSRYCGGRSILDGEVTGASFILRADDEYLSVNWLELLRLGGRDSEIEEVKRVLGTKMNLGSTAKIAVLIVGDTQDHVRQNSRDHRDLRILHRPDEPPDKPDPSHSGIFDTKEDEQLIAELIAEKVLETYAAR